MAKHNIFILENGNYGQSILDYLNTAEFHAEWFKDPEAMMKKSVPSEIPDMYILVDNFLCAEDLYREVFISSIRSADPEVHIVGVNTSKCKCTKAEYDKLIQVGCTDICPMNLRLIKKMVITLFSQSVMTKGRKLVNIK